MGKRRKSTSHFQEPLKGADILYNKDDVKMLQKTHDRITVSLRALYACQHQREIQCTLLAEQLAIKGGHVMVNKNPGMKSRSNQERGEGELQQEMLT